MSGVSVLTDVKSKGIAQNTDLRSVVLLSGGIDSAVCVHLLKTTGRHVSGVFVDYGQAASDAEAEASKSVANHFGIDLRKVTVTADKSFSEGEILGRNAFLIYTALVLTGGFTGSLVLGIHQGTQYYDCTPAFVRSMDALLSEHSDGRIHLSAPLLYWNKGEIFEYCRRESIPFGITYSCERGSRPVCGSCSSCMDRLNINAGTKTLN